MCTPFTIFVTPEVAILVANPNTLNGNVIINLLVLYNADVIVETTSVIGFVRLAMNGNNFFPIESPIKCKSFLPLFLAPLTKSAIAFVNGKNAKRVTSPISYFIVVLISSYRYFALVAKGPRTLTFK